MKKSVLASLLLLFSVPALADCWPAPGTPVTVSLLAPFDPQVSSYAVVSIWLAEDGMLRLKGEGPGVHRINPDVAELAAVLFRTMTPDADGSIGEYAITARCWVGRLRTEHVPGRGAGMLFFLRNHFALGGL